jgi:hypothetical protein
MPTYKIPSIRFPLISRVPSGVPIGMGWFTLVYNPGNDTTYKAEMLEMPFVATNDFFRIVSRGQFYNEWNTGKLKPGRISRIVNRTGTRPTSEVIVYEIGAQKIGLSFEVFPDGTNPTTPGRVQLIGYNPGNDEIIGFIESLSPEQLKALLEAGDGITIDLHNGKVRISCTVTPTQQITQPDAPTDGVVDDIGDTFSFLPVPGYPTIFSYKAFGLPGTTTTVAFDASNSYMQNGRIYLRVVGPVQIGGLAVYVAGSGSLPDGKQLLNKDAFTGAVIVAGTKAIAPEFGAIDDVNNIVAVSSQYAYTEVVAGIEGQAGQQLPSNSIVSVGNIAGRAFAYVRADAATNRLQSDIKYSTPFTLAATAPNTAPNAGLTIAGNPTTAVEGDTLTLQGSGTDADAGDSISKIEYLDNGVKMSGGETAGASGSFVTPPLTPGTHSFTTRATDTHNATGLSTARVVSVSAKPVVIPTYNTTLDINNNFADGIGFVPGGSETLNFDTLPNSPSGPTVSVVFTQGGFSCYGDYNNEFAGRPCVFTDRAGVRHLTSFPSSDTTVNF